MVETLLLTGPALSFFVTTADFEALEGGGGAVVPFLAAASAAFVFCAWPPPPFLLAGVVSVVGQTS